MDKITWDKEAEAALGRTPFFVRAMVRKKVSENVAKKGGSRVTLADFREAESKFRDMMAGKSRAELEGMMPKDNQPGVEMVVIEMCRNEISGCPHTLIRTSEWKEAVQRWVEEKSINERLRARVPGDRVLFHHKLRISVAGCPNGCSRPQIADIGIVGCVSPDVDPKNCTFCGACTEACPDDAIAVEGDPPVFDRKACQGCTACRDACPDGCIRLSPARARIILGGKLGRHPHLAEPIAEAETTKEMIEFIDGVFEDYIKNSNPGERYAEYFVRTKNKKI
jgi:anaerobic sulfite reductase subunit C